jgi:hypothetical protein
MFTTRVAGAVALVLAAAPWGAAQTYPLAEAVKAGDCFRVRLDMRLKGHLRVARLDKMETVPLEAVAAHEFPERVMAVGSSGMPEKSARVYEKADATIRAGRDDSTRTLRRERRLLVAQRQKDQLLVYSPTGGLRRSELELVEHLDTLAVVGVLPGKAVAVGDTWKVPPAVVQALCGFEGLAEQDVTGKLVEVKDGVGVFSLAGTARGIDAGAEVKTSVEATGRFNLSAGRLAGLEWMQKDERGQGPVSPESAVETTVTLKREKVEQPDKLSDVALVSVPDGPPPSLLLQLECPDPKGRFDLLHAREWHAVAQTEERTVLRLMDRGDWVAQATITPWTPAAKGQHLAPDEFKEKMNATSGWEPERELQAGEVPSEGDGRWIYRVSLQGRLDGLAVLQNFYLVAGPGGEQVVVAVTLAPKQAERLGARDLALVGSLEVPAPPAK